MTEFGLYFVSGRRAYRGHEPGTTFEARLDRNAEQRALNRGDIQLIRRTIPTIQPGTFAFPDGWLPATANQGQTRRHRAPLSLERSK